MSLAEGPSRHRRVRAPRREIFGWAMFDFANQSYTLLIVTVVFSVLFTQVIVGPQDGDYRLANLLWSLALATGYLMAVVTAPIFGAIMDYAAAKKRFLFGSYILTVISTAMLYFVEPGMVIVAMVLLILSNYGYAIGEAFIAGFLPDLGPPKDLGKISGFGWALGYVGGLFAAMFSIFLLGEVSAGNFERVRWVGPLAAAFFLLAAVPTFLFLRERGKPGPIRIGRSLGSIGLARVRATLRDVRQFRDLAVFFGSLFFMMAGIYIIISFSFIYGAQVIGWDENTRNIMFIAVQVTAVIGALAFGFIQDSLGARPTYILILVLWIGAIGLIYATPQVTVLINRWADLQWEAQHVFVGAGSLAGLCLGSSQSAGRAMVGLLSPIGKAAEFFGFWGLTMKLAACFGLAGIGLLQTMVGLHAAILFCILLFAVSIAICLFVDQKRGERVAEEVEDSGRNRSEP